MAGLLALMVGATLHHAAQADERAGGLVTVTFDDASRTQYEEGLPIAKEFGIPGTLFVITEKADEAQLKPQAWGMSWDNVAEFRDAGWEIASHSVSHPMFTEMPLDRVIRELEISRSEIEANVGVRPVTFASPFGEYNGPVLDLIMERYAYHVLAYGGTEGRNRNPAVSPREIGRMNIDKNMSPEAVCNEMEIAARNREWLVLMFHGFVTEPERFQTSPEAFREILGCAAGLRDSGALRIVTVRQAMELIDAK